MLEYSDNPVKIVFHVSSEGERCFALIGKKGRTLEFIFDAGEEYAPGALCVGRVIGKIGKSAYFVQIGKGRQAFLPKKGSLSFAEGDKVLVQIVKSSYGLKDAKVTTDIDFADICPEDRELLERDFNTSETPGIIKAAPDIRGHLLRKYGNSLSLVIFDDLGDRKYVDNFLSCGDFLSSVKTEYVNGNSFADYGLDEELEDALEPCVVTQEGIRIFFEKTQAFWSVDVDGFQSVRSFQEINMIAAAEILRQIRLRNISGQIVIDFISSKNHNIQGCLLDMIRKELKNGDREAFLAGVSPLGHVEIVRQRIYPSVSECYKRG